MQCLKFQRSEILEVVKDSIVADSLKFEMLRHLELGNVAGEILLMFLMCTPFLTLILKVLIQFKEEVLDPWCLLVLNLTLKWCILEDLTVMSMRGVSLNMC